MSGNLFINAEKELQRMELLLRKLRNYNFASSEHKTAAINGKESVTFYNGTVTGNKLDGEYVYLQVDGESFPDLYQKIADQLSEKLQIKS
jgi:hypothetical protein